VRGVNFSSGTELTMEYAPPLVGLGRYAARSEARSSAARVMLAGGGSLGDRHRSRSAFAAATRGVCRRTRNEPDSLRATAATVRTGASFLVAELTVRPRYSAVGLDHHGFGGSLCACPLACGNFFRPNFRREVPKISTRRSSRTCADCETVRPGLFLHGIGIETAHSWR